MSLKRLDHQMRKLKKQPGMLQKYDDIIQDQLTQGIMEQPLKEPERKQFYLPHKAVVRETAESTKIGIVYDGSAQSRKSVPFLNECSETGPPTQNHHSFLEEIQISTSETFSRTSQTKSKKSNGASTLTT